MGSGGGANVRCVVDDAVGGVGSALHCGRQHGVDFKCELHSLGSGQTLLSWRLAMYVLVFLTFRFTFLKIICSLYMLLAE